MSANSKHWGDINIWIIKVIYSCKTSSQIYNTKILIKRFTKMNIIPKDQSDYIIEWLYTLRRIHWDNILKNSIKEEN